MFLRRLLVALILLGTGALPARASTITWEFSGTFLGIGFEAYKPLLGTEFHGIFSFDSEQTHSDPLHAFYETAAWVIDLPGLDSVWTYQKGFMQVYAASTNCFFGGPPQCLVLGAQNGTSSNPDAPPALPIEMRTLFSGFPTDDLPLEPPVGVKSVFGFPNVFFTINWGYTEDLHSTSSVPEPASLVLLGIGLVLGGWRLRRKPAVSSSPTEPLHRRTAR